MEGFVTYEQAVKLKENQFDWPCITYYTSDYVDDAHDGITDNAKLYHHGSNYNYNRILGYTCAPSLYCAAKWLREVKGIYVVVEPRFSNYKLIGYDWMVYDDCSGDYALRAPLPFSRTYESALSAAIDATLDLIITQKQ